MHLNIRKALQGFFLCIFSSLSCLKNKHVFSKGDLVRWKATARLYWDLLTSGRACHNGIHGGLFKNNKLKKKKNCFAPLCVSLFKETGGLHSV
jgi:hypothetical protein